VFPLELDDMHNNRLPPFSMFVLSFLGGKVSAGKKRSVVFLLYFCRFTSFQFCQFCS